MAFRDGRVREVRFKKPWVSGKIFERKSDNSVFVTFKLFRDGFQSAQCECGSHDPKNKCEHIAALIIWWMARGSLLRAGITDEEEGTGQHHYVPSSDSNTTSTLPKGGESSKKSAPALDPIPAEPVGYVHLVSRDDNVIGISMEPALRYKDPAKKKTRVEMVRVLRKDPVVPLLWKNLQGQPLETVSEDVPFLHALTAPRLTYMGQAAVQFLGRILSSDQTKRIVLDPALKVEFVPIPLKLSRFEIGARKDNKRQIRFFFTNGKHTIDSEELKELAAEGRLSHEFAWSGTNLFQFEMPLSTLARHISRSGLNILETIGMKPLESLSEIDDDREHPLHPLAVLRLSLELGAKEFYVDPDWTEFHEWRKNFDKKSSPKLPSVKFGFDLREYQQNGLTWIWSLYHRGLAAFLADDMGLGKTHQVLAFLSSIYCSSKFRPNEPSVVVAPTSVVAAWQQKLERYDTGLRWYIYHGSARELPHNGIDVIITTYGILQRDQVLRERQWHVAIADESQAIKNANTSTSRISRALKARFRIAMTGTPVENSSTDLWSVLEFLLPGYLGSQARFKRLYGSKNENLTADKAVLVKKLVNPFLLRRTKSQVLTELPEKTEETVLCQLTQAQKQVYNAYLRSQEVSKMRSDLASEEKRIDYTGILALLTKLKQVCDHPLLPELTSHAEGIDVRTVDPLMSGKWETLQEIISESVGSNLKVVVFTQFLSVLDLLKVWLEKNGIGYAELRGDTKDRGGELEKFRSDPRCQVFVCSLMAGGLGIDLTAASVCIHYDRWWNPARENQATDRLHRIGQTRGVQVFKLQCPGTVEDRVASIIERKVALSGSLIEDSSLGLKSFSRHELLELLTELAQTT